jgi:hypothetical protein
MSKNKSKKYKSKNSKKNLKKETLTKSTFNKKAQSAKLKTSKDKKEIIGKKTIVKKSLTTVQIKKSSLGTSFLIVALSLCALAVGVIVLILLSQFTHKEKLFAPPVPSQLSTIQNEETFLTIKNSLLQNSLKQEGNSNECLGANFFHTSSKKTAYAYDKFIIILKRGKIFVTNTTTNKFVGYTEISPYPIKENNAIAYDNVFFDNGVIIVTGYRTETKSMEVATFPISIYGKVTRGETYSLPSSNCNYASNLTHNKLTFYTSRELTSTTTLENIKILNQWSHELNEFTATYPEINNIFYDNSSFLNNPTIHSITTCDLQGHSLANCQQRHLIDNESAGHHLDQDYFYLWTAQLPVAAKSKSIIPNAKLHQFNLSDSLIKMTQVEGLPISTNALLTNNGTLSAIIYQNSHRSPAWQTNFTKNKIAHFNLSSDEFSTTGSFINSPDNYTLTSSTRDSVLAAPAEIIALSPKLITLNKDTSTINVHTESLKSFSIDGSILSGKKLPHTELVLIIYKKNNSVAAQIINIDTGTISNALSLQENITTKPPVEISFLNIQDKIFASVAITEESLSKGSIHLLDISTSTITRPDTLTFTKSQQRLTDGCQNDCQQVWKDQLKYFAFSNSSVSLKNDYLYATIGSKLRKLVVDSKGVIHLYKTIDYTYRPAPPKPKRPAARIPGGAKVVNGKYVCKKKKDYVGKSKKNNKGYLHLDMECCLDPDEYPNPWCTYRPGELGVTNLRYKDYHGKIKRKKH